MAQIPQSRLDQVADRFSEIEARMNAVSDAQEIIRLSKEHAELKPVAEAVSAVKAAREQAAELSEMASGSDELAEMAREELRDLKERLPAIERELQILLLPRDKDDTAAAILEIRAGTGGDEAALFAGDLFRMYQRYASLRGWRLEVTSASEGEMGGYKEIIAEVSGEGVFGRLKWESGVHRVQRVPETETQGRIHTSAATVAVLPKPDEIEIEIKAEDIRIDTMRASGAGGQHVNTTDSAVRITHLPTGIVVTSSEKSQHANRAKAMAELQVRLYDKQRSEAQAALAADRKAQVGSGDRSERIRTYNFPQGRVTDHRINLTLYKLGEIVAGDALDELIDALITEDQSLKLAAMES